MEPRPARILARSLLAALFALPLPAAGATAQSEPAPAAEDRKPVPVPRDPYERGTPRGSMHGFLVACRNGDYTRAANHLDLSELPEGERAARAPGLARRLKFVLDQKLWVDLGKLSEEPEGNLKDGLLAVRELVGRVPTAQGEVDIHVERVPREDGVLIWKIASATVARIPDLYQELGYGWVVDVLPPTLVDVQFLEIALWQWIGLLLLLVTAYFLAWLAAWLVMLLLKPLTSRTETDLDDRILGLMTGPLRLLATIGFFTLGILCLKLAVPAREFFQGVAKILVIAGVAWLVFRVIDLFASITRERLLESGRPGATHLVPLGARAIKIGVGALTVLAALDTFGFDITAVIAGLGVGGLAIALAAQKTVENVFGGVSVLVDQPVLPGDFCRFGDKMGIVEDIGVRSTRVRTLDRTVLTIPNADFSTQQIENFARRDRIRLITTLGLRYETSPDQMRFVLAGIRRLLISHPKVLPDPLRVRFVNFGAYSLDVEIFAYVDTRDINEFHAVREDIFLRLIDLVDEAGTGFAFPSSTTYLGRDGGLDAEKTRAAEAQVEQWREQGALMFPDYSSDEVARMDDTLDWPPRGSPGAREA